MFALLKRVGIIGNAVRGWIFILITAVPTVVAWLLAIAEGYSWSLVFAFALAALASGAVAGYYGLRAFDEFTAKYGSRKVVDKVADKLEQMRQVGHTTLALGDAAQIWHQKNLRRLRLEH